MSELKSMIARGEGLHQDFKFRIDDQKKIARTLCAFANTEGGSLLIGVKDNGKIAGVEPSEEFHMIQGAAELYCKPPVPVEMKIWQEEFRLVLEIIVSKTGLLHKSPDEDGKEQVYVRVEDNTIVANKILLNVWKHGKSPQSRPEFFDEPQLELLRIIETHQPVSLSKLYKLSTLKYRQVDRLLVLFICWDLVEMHLAKERTGFSLKEVV